MRAIPFMGILGAVSLAAVISGCAASPNVKQAALMPREAALKIVSQYAGSYWANSPHVYNGLFCGNERVAIQYADITKAVVDLDGTTVWVQGKGFLDCRNGNVLFRNLRGEAADEFATALHSLGAQI